MVRTWVSDQEPPRRPRRGEERDGELGAWAMESFAELGYNGVSPDDIVRDVGGPNTDTPDFSGGKGSLFTAVMVAMNREIARPLRKMTLSGRHLEACLPGRAKNPSAPCRTAPTSSHRFRQRATVLAGFLIGFIHVAGAASPIPEPTIDLGETSFLDGEAGQGALLEVIGNGYVANYATNSSGNAGPGPDHETSSSLTLHLAYLSNIPALYGHLGLEVLFPFAAVHLHAPGVPETTQGGVGDITIAPFIQWSDLPLFGRPFSMRLGLQGVVPTGTYSSERLINMGQNVWQFSPYYAFTWRARTRWEISGRLIYDWSSRNPAPPAMLQATSAQPGAQIALNLSASYALNPHWRIGIAGYGLRQLNPTRVNDIAVRGSEQQAFALGPAVLWSNRQVTVIGNVYREFATENRPEGFNAVFRVLKPF